MRASNWASFARVLLVHPIELLQQVELPSLLVPPDPLVADVLDQLLDGVVLRVDIRSLVDSRQEARLPVLRFLDRVSARTHGDKGRQVLVFRSQAVNQPRTEARPNQPPVAAVHQQQRRLVIGNVGVHRTNHGDFVDHLSDAGKQLADFDPALAAFVELEGRGHRRSRLPLRGQIGGRQRLAGVLRQRGFWIERVDVRRAAVHEQVDDVLRLGGKRRRLGHERGLPAPPAGCANAGASPSCPKARPARPRPLRARSSRREIGGIVH